MNPGSGLGWSCHCLSCRQWGELGGAGSILTSANEMAEWIHMQLNGSVSQSGRRVVDASVLSETHRAVNGQLVNHEIRAASTANPVWLTQYPGDLPLKGTDFKKIAA